MHCHFGDLVWAIPETGLTNLCLQHATQLRDFAADMGDVKSVHEVLISFSAVQEERAMYCD